MFVKLTPAMSDVLSDGNYSEIQSSFTFINQENELGKKLKCLRGRAFTVAYKQLIFEHKQLIFEHKQLIFEHKQLIIEHKQLIFEHKQLIFEHKFPDVRLVRIQISGCLPNANSRMCRSVHVDLCKVFQVWWLRKLSIVSSAAQKLQIAKTQHFCTKCRKQFANSLASSSSQLNRMAKTLWSFLHKELRSRVRQQARPYHPFSS